MQRIRASHNHAVQDVKICSRFAVAAETSWLFLAVTNTCRESGASDLEPLRPIAKQDWDIDLKQGISAVLERSGSKLS